MAMSPHVRLCIQQHRYVILYVSWSLSNAFFHDTGDFGAAQQGHAEDEPLAPVFSTTNNNDISDNEMALPCVTQPLPPAPPASTDLAAALALVPPPPVIPK